MLIDSRCRIRNGTGLRQRQPELALSEFTASNFTVHRSPESSGKAFLSLAPGVSPFYPVSTLPAPCIPFSQEEFRGADSLKCKVEPWRCTLAFRSCDDVFHRGLDKKGKARSSATISRAKLLLEKRDNGGCRGRLGVRKAPSLEPVEFCAFRQECTRADSVRFSLAFYFGSGGEDLAHGIYSDHTARGCRANLYISTFNAIL